MLLAQSAGAAEYTDSISAEEQDSSNEYPRYDTKQSNSKASVMWELWGMWSISSLPSLPGPLWTGMVKPYRILSTGQNETE